jgi:diguanylate cyclase (GGDEF)-like protein
VVARYGGEEFAALAVGPGTADLPAAAEAARQAIAAAPIAWHGRQLHVTASFGGAPSIGGEAAEQAVERADRALYASKAAGRNCTHWCDGTDTPRLVPQRGPAEDARADRGMPIGSRAASAEQILAQVERPAGGTSSDALLDAETGLPTRMALVHELRRRLAERRRLGGDMAVLLMELTDLAHRGHGPAATRQGLPALVGTLLKANAREMDLAARYGAARFALLLPGATLDEALAASRRLRAALVVYDDVRVRLLPRRCRWTGGLAVARDDDDAAVLLRRAETALRAAAIAGRDQVYVHDGVTCAAADEAAAQPA